MSHLINYLILIIPVLVNIAFITLLERKILGYSQLRKGPNKVGLIGIFQPFNDAIKLFSKELFIPSNSNFNQYLIAPLCALLITLVRYSLFPLKEYIISISWSFIFLYLFISINIYPLLISGWASNRKYALIGSMRAIAQTVSYEVRLAAILIFYIRISYSINIEILMSINSLWNKVIILFPIMGIWFISCLAETNRTPFDFAEGESELVSGFNIEYGGIGFAIIFMAEYGRILFLSILFSILFVSSSTSSVSLYVITSLLVSIWVWVRTTFPRYRYDKLINLAWKVYLPIVLFILSYSIFF